MQISKTKKLKLSTVNCQLSIKKIKHLHMKYVITGGAGHISKPITEALLKAGHQIKVIGRNPEHLSELKAKGVETAIGSVEDPAFVAQAFAGADAVYTMI